MTPGTRIGPYGVTARVLAAAAGYYLATQLAWILCFPDSKVSLFFPPHALLVSILLLVPTRHWWAYTLAAAAAHFLATQVAGWPFAYAVQCEAFDAVQNVSAAAGVRLLLSGPLRFATIRETVVFVVIAAVVVPFGSAFWGAAFTVSNGYGTRYWIEWRNLGVSNAVTAIVLVPALLGSHYWSSGLNWPAPRRLFEAGCLVAGLLIVGFLAFDYEPAGPDTSPALLYAPVIFLVWAALRFDVGGTSALMVIMACLAIWGTMQGRGPFLTQAPAQNAFALQTFLLVISIPLLFLAVIVEEDRRSRLALRESEERYREVVDSQTDLVCRHLADETLTFVNDAVCRWLQRPREDLIGRRLADVVPPPAREALAANIAAANRERVAVTREVALLKPDTTTTWHQWTTFPVIGADGAIVEFQATGHDITDRKRAEEARQLLAHATRLSTMGALAGSLAHELNQPLAAILSNAEASSRYLEGPNPNVAEVQAALRDIAADALRTGDVIRHMRALVRKDQPTLMPLDLNRVILDVARLLHRDAVVRRIEIVFDLDAALRPAQGDSVQVQQVVLNLVLNAFDAMTDAPDGGRMVLVRTRQLDVDTVRVDVCDHGTGLRPDQLSRLFEPFRTSKADGLGLGLSISQSIVEAHLGRIWAENNPARGATFFFTLPTHRAPVTPPS